MYQASGQATVLDLNENRDKKITKNTFLKDSRRRQGMYEAMGAGRRGKFKGRGTGRHDQDQDTSDTSSSMNNSRGSTSVRDTLEKRRMQVPEGDGERDGDDNATTAANDEGNGEDGADDDQDGEEQQNPDRTSRQG